MFRVPSLHGGLEKDGGEVPKEARAGVLSTEISPKKIREIFEKRLAERRSIRTVSLPFDSRWRRKVGHGERRRQKARFFLRIFSEGFRKMFGKDVDGGMAEVLAETLSPKGKLFEIYFVRLIGTPNQQFKKRSVRLFGAEQDKLVK